MTIKTTDEEYKRCVCAAYQKAFGDQITPSELRPTENGLEVDHTDIKNMLAGSCIAELIGDDVEMTVEI